MSSKSTSRAETRNALARLLERGEEAVGVFVEELLSNKVVADQLGKTLGRAMTAKKRVDKNMQTMLSLLNVPSKADLSRLQHKLEALQGSVVNISMKLDRVLAAQHEHKAEHVAAPHHAPAAHAAPKRAKKTRKRATS
jgi:hypothetical protein